MADLVSPADDTSGERRPRPSLTPAIEIRELTKTFKRRGGQVVHAIDDVNLVVQPHEIVVLLGPSGCGKTTLLRSVAGFERPDSGTISIAGRTVFSSSERQPVPPEKRPVGMIFQSYALWPHMTVFENVAYPLRCQKLKKAEIEELTRDMLRKVGLEDLTRQHPSRLSGGQQQRVALARALVSGEEVLLFDEPLSNVDANVRERLREELLNVQAEFGFAALYVTHDQQEAMELANKVAVLNNGRVVQLGSPRDVYERPTSHFVSTFVGRMNQVEGVVKESHGEEVIVQSQLGPITCRVANAGAGLTEGMNVVVGWRPEGTVLHPSAGGSGVWPGRVVAELFEGAYTDYIIDLGPVTCRVSHAQAFEQGAEVWVEVQSGAAMAMAIEPDAVE